MATVKLVNIRPGKRNGDVLIVQKALAAAVGLDYSSAPGFFGSRTRAAYTKWQQSLGLRGADADGVPGTKSLKALGKKYKFSVSAADGGGKVAASGRVKSPVPGHRVTYRFGVRNRRYQAGFHTGDDYAARTGTPVIAVRAGRIAWSNGAGRAYGNWIGLKADNGRVYVYCHLSARAVNTRALVKAGQVIGRVGATGRTTGPHLHFEDHPAGRFRYGQCREPSW
ncbi:peptidoglycan DD-metalloendopeptidase family protein [Archangium lansingense]|uniref:Peptidoglycan DD-metalloendopeptidase family protein n=1 Tax=Archangium lansingense TaxID=2995310 RepID=A0ABT4A0N7_9BACT|nr:peptidoglycan DD-metalloendopeptidase family protein [Archangium lansinium]MCY1074544.1 peptidoglycan DD-metalloendopeptidase family protein [Archangium lansinium]